MARDFNLSTRRSDFSTRLRSAGLSNASKTKSSTKELERETKEMESRLQSLKTTLASEKGALAARTIRSGGPSSIWRSGAAPPRVPKKPIVDPSSKPPKEAFKRVRVLRDEPLPKAAPVATKEELKRRLFAPLDDAGRNGALPSNPWADDDEIGDAGSFSGVNGVLEDPLAAPSVVSKCGQCDRKRAHLRCVECGEEYCATCFASFHARGALKKHRTVPIAAGDRVARGGTPISARSRTPLSTRSLSTPEIKAKSVKDHKPTEGGDVDGGGGGGGGVSGKTKGIRVSQSFESDFVSVFEFGDGDAYSTAGSESGDSGSGGGGALWGVYDESQNRREFREALRAFRGEAKAEEPLTSHSKTPNGTSKPSTKDSKHSSLGVVESGTGDDMEAAPAQQPLAAEDLRFTSSISYAERLLLKQGRRGAAEPKKMALEEATLEDNVGEDEDDDEVFQGPRISFDSIFNMVRQSEAMKQKWNDETESVYCNNNNNNDVADHPVVAAPSFVDIRELETKEEKEKRNLEIELSTEPIVEAPSPIVMTPPIRTTTPPSPKINPPLKFQPPVDVVDEFLDLPNFKREPSTGHPLRNGSSTDASDAGDLLSSRTRASAASRESLRRFENLERLVAEGIVDGVAREDVGGEEDPAKEVDLNLTLDGRKESKEKKKKSSKSSLTASENKTASNSTPRTPQSTPLTPSTPKLRVANARPPSMQRRCSSALKSGAPLEGFFTKAASTALKDIAVKSVVDARKSTAGNEEERGFLLIGVEPVVANSPVKSSAGSSASRSASGKKNSKNRSASMSGSRRGSGAASSAAKSAGKKSRVSYKTYQMCPRSWRPGSSLSGNADAPVDPDADPPSSGTLTRPASRAYGPRPPTPGSGFGLFGPGGTPAALKTPRKSSATTTTTSQPRRPDRRILVDGDDMSAYDGVDDDDDDDEALEGLEWELASESGRVTAEEKIGAEREEDEDSMEKLDSLAAASSSSASLEKLRLQLQRELCFRGNDDDDEKDDRRNDDDDDDEFEKRKFRMEAEREVMELK